MDNRFEKILTGLMALSAVGIIMLICFSGVWQTEGAVASSINDHPGIMRFHVIANSNSDEDQALKLEVRDYVLQRVEAGITSAIAADTKDTGKAETSDKAVDFERQAQITRAYINENLPQIQTWAAEAVAVAGASYGVSAQTGVRHIPAKQYDDMFFPEGNYEALTITIGEGKGENWWCVVFPPLCLIDSENSAYEEEFDISEEDRLILKFKTEELLSGHGGAVSGNDSGIVCKSSISDVLCVLVGDNAR